MLINATNREPLPCGCSQGLDVHVFKDGAEVPLVVWVDTATGEGGGFEPHPDTGHAYVRPGEDAPVERALSGLTAKCKHGLIEA
jgi:hypothetical protein